MHPNPGQNRFAVFFQMLSITSSVGCGSKVPSWADVDVRALLANMENFPYCFPIGLLASCYGIPIENENPGRPMMGEKKDVLQGTLALMILKTLEALGPLHGYGIARRIEQTSGDLLSLNYGTLYPALLKLEQEGFISAEWGVSDNNRKAKYYKLTRAGHRELERETRDWHEPAAILPRFFAANEER